MIRKISFILAIVLAMSLLGCSGSIEEIVYDMPTEGVWYCAELETTIVFDRVNEIVQPSYIVIDGKIVNCICEGEYNTPYLFLCCQETGISEFDLGEIIYWWTLIAYNENELTLEDYETQKLYYFDRVS